MNFSWRQSKKTEHWQLNFLTHFSIVLGYIRESASRQTARESAFRQVARESASRK